MEVPETEEGGDEEATVSNEDLAALGADGLPVLSKCEMFLQGCAAVIRVQAHLLHMWVGLICIVFGVVMVVILLSVSNTENTTSGLMTVLILFMLIFFAFGLSYQLCAIRNRREGDDEEKTDLVGMENMVILPSDDETNSDEDEEMNESDD